ASSDQRYRGSWPAVPKEIGVQPRVKGSVEGSGMIGRLSEPGAGVFYPNDVKTERSKRAGYVEVARCIISRDDAALYIDVSRAGVENLGNGCKWVKRISVEADGTIGNIHGTRTRVRNATTVAIRKILSDSAVGDADSSGAVV